jgi:hypothetical protein
MPLRRYFKENQKITINSFDDGQAGSQTDALTCYLKTMGRSHLDLTLPYNTAPGEHYPFEQTKTLEIYTDANGLGICVTGTFEKYLGDKLMRVKHNSDLRMIQRRIEERCDITLDLGYTKGKGKLKTLREQWEKNTKTLASPDGQAKLPKFPQINANLSSTGIGFPIKAPVAKADLCLLYINLNDGGAPICILAEVVWHSEQQTNGRCMAGFQFLNILDSDRKRITKFVKTQMAEEAKE